jgi:hypothetical protein
MVADMAGCGQREAGRAAGGDRRHEAGELVVKSETQLPSSSRQPMPETSIAIGEPSGPLTSASLAVISDVERGLGHSCCLSETFRVAEDY